MKNINSFLSRIAIFSTICIMLIANSNIFAQEIGNTGKHTYIRADVGYSYLQGKVDRGYKKHHDGAVLGAIGGGYEISPGFRADVIGSYRGIYEVSYTNASKRSINQKITSLAWILNGYYSPAPLRSETFKPYIVGGIGLSINKAGDIRVGNMTALGKCKENLAWQLGIGSFYKLNNRMNLDFMYRFLYLGKVTTANLAQTAATCCSTVPKQKGLLKAHEASIGINYFF